MKTSSGRALRQFYKTTTLHGLKYLCSKYYYDRVCWLACCCASACCAGVLCAVLWARFLQVPALLTLHDFTGQAGKIRLPQVAVCPTSETVAYLLQQQLSADSNYTKRLPTILDNILRRKSPTQEQLELLQDILSKNYLNLQDALMLILPSCDKIVLNCRWQSYMLPCENLFEKELTEWGACCVMRPENMKFNMGRPSYLEVTNNLHIAVQCTDQPVQNGCEFFTRYNGEEWVEPILLSPGYNYLAQISFTSIVDEDSEKLVDGKCISTQEYTRRECLLKCREKFCKCTDPMQRQKDVTKFLPICQVIQLKCLRTFTTSFEKNSCKCLPSCKKITTYVLLESSLMNAVNESYDQIYAGSNITTSSVLRMGVKISGSRIFVVNPTETWITLLFKNALTQLDVPMIKSITGNLFKTKSILIVNLPTILVCLFLPHAVKLTASLGGVFNMFLGVGLSSALELLFLVFVRLPIAIRKSTEMESAPVVGH